MALTQIERDGYKKGLEILESLGTYHHSLEDSFPNINEDTDTGYVNKEDLFKKYGLTSTFRDLDAIQDFMEGKKFDFTGFTPLYDGIDIKSGFKVLINFMGNKNVKVDKNDNFLGIGFNFGRNYNDELRITIENSDRNSCEIEEFMELATSTQGNVEITVADIASMSDVNRIYDTYSQVAMKEMERLSPAAYSIFSNPALYKGVVRYIDGRECTLFVTYNSSTNSFMYGYNPSFILKAALDEWNVNRRRYESLKDCYIYLLTFFITHEMMHIIHNNTVRREDGEEGENTDIEKTVGDHRVINVVEDSFINCNIVKMFNGFNGVVSDDGYAPFPRLCVSNRMKMRSTHNKGFKTYNNSGEFYDAIYDLMFKTLRLDNNVEVINRFNMTRDLSIFAGADFFVDINVSPNFDRIRKYSSMLQKFFNDLVKLLTDAPVFETMGGVEFTDEEKASDYNILPDGTLVRKKNTNVILIVSGYDEKDGKYILSHTTEDGIEETKNSDGSTTYKQKYKPTGSNIRLSRSKIVPLKDEEITWTDEPDDFTANDSKLSSEDIDSAKNTPNNYIELLLNYIDMYEIVSYLYNIYSSLGDSKNTNDIVDMIDKCRSFKVGRYVDNDECASILGKKAFEELLEQTKDIIKNASQNQNQGNNGGGQEKKTKKLRVGDIVWVRTANSFGRITAIRNGMFEIEQVHEKPCIILDDSNNY